METKFIDKMGIEIEGGWSTVVRPSNLGHDGSVNVPGATHVGEKKSAPLKHDTAIRWLGDEYPDLINATCGLHVHFSFKKVSDYSRLMDERFQHYFIARMTKWGDDNGIRNKEFFNRLGGRNDFCKKVWDADGQAAMTGKGSLRYAHWNFCYRIHGTAECRMLPAFKHKEWAQRAVTEVARIVEDYLCIAPVAVEVDVEEEETSGDIEVLKIEERI